MIGTEQLVPSMYHPQLNGLCERQNRTIKDSLVKALVGIPFNWPNLIEEDLFPHRVSKHTSAKFSPFFPMYNLEPTLPKDVNKSLVATEGNESEHTIDKETFDALLTTVISMRGNIYETAGEKIKVRQKLFLKN